MSLLPKCIRVKLHQNIDETWNGWIIYKWLFWEFEFRFSKFKYNSEIKEIKFDRTFAKGVDVVVSYFSKDDSQEVRGYQIQKGDIFTVDSDSIDTHKPKVGTCLTVYPNDYRLKPLVTTSYCKIQGKYQIVKTHMTDKKWWQFWKIKKVIGYDVECLEV